jgi:hypothetical protein
MEARERDLCLRLGMPPPLTPLQQAEQRMDVMGRDHRLYIESTNSTIGAMPFI